MTMIMTSETVALLSERSPPAALQADWVPSAKSATLPALQFFGVQCLIFQPLRSRWWFLSLSLSFYFFAFVRVFETDQLDKLAGLFFLLGSRHRRTSPSLAAVSSCDGVLDGRSRPAAGAGAASATRFQTLLSSRLCAVQP